MRRGSERTPSGFHSNGTHRNRVTGSLIAQSRNPYLNECPVCYAPRYVRCHRSVAPVNGEGGFMYLLDTPHAERVTSRTSEDAPAE